MTESDSERGNIGSSLREIGHEITEIVSESTEMVGQITEIVGDMTEIGRILITSSRKSFSTTPGLSSLDSSQITESDGIKPRLLSLSSTSARGALGRVFVSGVGAAVN
jgi:hypothetical protein